ncbi:Phage protein D [Achromobacter xylosoxidans]|uniref:contractile injection system protein, VgrG/Pvc8 family n=1 Tax=Alcaligenes xylosoxydans xylosoxydans TaxID=85698 RepID=UPI0006C254C4|nr:contractile injection system protein, VgrG/Pvc8 family [Achromobacter xylosoxidans]MCH1988941.1 phage late control D family protein [Achromobacter xylosoxidans]MCH1994206.1 phage late control D family protein [Achromobacter xylosoxidans]MCH4585337.1 phage late control D family protein [Achromobacter xylosoxidans]CUI71032.1 Phage protein D [Achromobacter xylosoxidans]
MFAAQSAESAAAGQPPEAYRYPRPIWRVIVDGKDVTGNVRPRLQSLTITECRSDQADQLDLVLDDHDGRLELPARGVSVRVLLGWESTGLVDKGTFEVDEVEFSGPPDIITLRARSADMKSALRTRSARSFHGTTIKAIVETIAKAHGLTAVVGTFGNTKVQHIDQTDESDLAFLNRIGKRYDAVATVKDKRLLFLPIEHGKTASGKDMPTITLSRRDGDRIRFHIADRDSYTGVRASWQDKGKAKRRHVLAGVIGNAKRLRQLYASESDALEAARAEWARIRRGMATFEMDLAYGRPDLSPQTKIQLPSLKAPLNEYTWLNVKLVHQLDGNGLTTKLEAETAEAADARAEDEAQSGGDLPAVDVEDAD